jgi:hypothetical protein
MCLLDFLKIDIDEADEAILQGVQWPCEPIYFILEIEKSDFD